VERGEVADLAYGWCAATRFRASCGSPSAAVRSGFPAASPSRRRAQTWCSLFVAPCALPVFPPPWSGTTVRPSVPAFPLRMPGGGPAAPAKSARSRTPPAQVHRPLNERGEESKRRRRRSGRCESSRLAKTCLLRRFASTVLSLTSARLRNSPHQKAPPRWGSDSPRRLAPIATPEQWVPARICSPSTVPRLRDLRRRSWPPCHFQAPHRPRGEEKRIAWRWNSLGPKRGANPASHNPRHPPGRAATAQRERCPTAL